MLVLGLRRVSRHESASIVPAMIVAAVLLAAHALNFIPPVPLVKKEMLIAHSVQRRGSEYIAMVESPGWRRYWRSSSPRFHWSGERVYCFTSVFVPSGISTTIRHRWLQYDEEEGEWRNAGVVPFTIAGGRETGYRGYTYKQRVTPGRWRVVAESESGAALGITDFLVVRGEAGTLKRLRL